MPRVIVTADAASPPGKATVLLDEQVKPVHLSSGHAAAQLVERIAWAISDAEDAEAAAPVPQQVRVPRGSRTRAHGRRPRRELPQPA
jgi:hypothetical protein